MTQVEQELKYSNDKYQLSENRNAQLERDMGIKLGQVAKKVQKLKEEKNRLEYLSLQN